MHIILRISINLILITHFLWLFTLIIPGNAQQVTAGLHINTTFNTISASEQYYMLIHAIMTFNFGNSTISEEPVLFMISHALQPTLIITLTSLLVSIVFSISITLLYIHCNPHTSTTYITFFTTISISIPEFIIANFFLLMFSIKYPLIPLYTTHASRYILPIISLSIVRSAILLRSLYTSLTLEMQQNYCLPLYLAGVPHWRIITFHILPNALHSFISIATLQFMALIGGSVIIEYIFGISGFGHLIHMAINTRDIPLIHASLSILIILFTLIRTINQHLTSS